MAFFGLENHFREANQDVRGFIEAKFAHFELTALKKTVEISSRVVKVFLCILFGGFFLVFGSIGVALIIGERLENISYGFFTVAGFYLFVMLILLLFGRRMISIGVVRRISRKMANRSTKSAKR